MIRARRIAAALIGCGVLVGVYAQAAPGASVAVDTSDVFAIKMSPITPRPGPDARSTPDGYALPPDPSKSPPPTELMPGESNLTALPNGVLQSPANDARLGPDLAKALQGDGLTILQNYVDPGPGGGSIRDLAIDLSSTPFSGVLNLSGPSGASLDGVANGVRSIHIRLDDGGTIVGVELGSGTTASEWKSLSPLPTFDSTPGAQP